MAYVKTAVSIERQTFDAGEALARELHISRSDLYTRALQALIRQRKTQALQQQIDLAAEAIRAQEGDTADTAEALHRVASAAMQGAIERGESTW